MVTILRDVIFSLSYSGPAFAYKCVQAFSLLGIDSHSLLPVCMAGRIANIIFEIFPELKESAHCVELVI